MLDKEQLLKKIAPCSLVCYTCSSYEHGVICKAAKELLEYLDGAEGFYERHHPAQAARFRIFADGLSQYAAGKCAGCRGTEHHDCSIQGCFILECTKERRIDFCGECEEFPCGKTRAIFEEEVYQQWLEGNQEIRAQGIAAFWEKNRGKPHYIPYKK